MGFYIFIINGSHMYKSNTDDGRIMNDMLVLYDTYLRYE
jgi:hypothetical protein